MEADIPVVNGGGGLLDEVAEYEALHASLETQLSSTTSQLHVALSAVSLRVIMMVLNVMIIAFVELYKMLMVYVYCSTQLFL